MEFLEDIARKNARSAFKSNKAKRKMLYEKYQVLLSNQLTYKQITDKMLERSKKKDAQYYFLEHLSQELSEGKQFSEALDGWAATNEITIIGAGEKSGEYANAFKQCADLLGKLIEMKKTIIAASIYPSFLMLALFGIIYGFANFMLPILQDFSDPATWPGFAQTLKSVTEWISTNILFVLLTFGIIGVVVAKSMEFLTGTIRDKVLDRIPPYSLYKEIQSGLFLSTLATLLQSGMTFSRSLEFIEAESPKYVQEKIGEIIESNNEGRNEGEALNIDFIGEVGDDIEDFSIGSDIGETMSKMGDVIVKEKIEKIQKSAGALKFIAMIIVFVFVLWAYGSFVTITQSMDV